MCIQIKLLQSYDVLLLFQLPLGQVLCSFETQLQYRGCLKSDDCKNQQHLQGRKSKRENISKIVNPWLTCERQ